MRGLNKWRLRSNLDWRDHAKRRAALEAVRNVKDGYVVGLGSGTTAAFAIEEIGRRIRDEKLRVLGVPTSYQAFMLAVRCRIPITTLVEHPQLDLDIDGADQIDPDLNLIKGRGGGAITKEKVVASAARKLIIVADKTKLTSKLGENQSVSVEVFPFAEPFVSLKIREMGGESILRKRKDNSGPFVTDNGNFILDVDFGVIKNPRELDLKLKMIPGVVETGLFVEMADIAYIGSETSVDMVERKR